MENKPIPMINLNPTQTQSEIKAELYKLNLNSELKSFVDNAFRVRVKFREATNQMTLQLRCFPPSKYEAELDLEEYRIILQDLVKDSGIDYVVLDYKECCMTGCQGCENYTI
jgi:hypothetical protein